MQAADPNDHVFELRSSNVTIQGFTIVGAIENYGIYVDLADYYTLSRNIISDNFYGISVKNSDHGVIVNNVIDARARGIQLYKTSDTALMDNNVSNGYVGVIIYFSSNNTLTNNDISKNENGLLFDYCSYHTLTGNTMSENNYNLRIGNTSESFTIDKTNRVNGKPVQYLVGEEGLVVDSSWDIGYLGIDNCTNITVKDLVLPSHNGEGLHMKNSTDCRIENVTSTDNYIGISLSKSSNNTLINNVLSNNNTGISLSSRSSHNNLSTNNISNNGRGIHLGASSYNNLTSNIVNSNNDYGIFLSFSPNNQLTANIINSNRRGLGIFYSGSYGNSITNNIMDSNSEYGLRFVAEAYNNTAINNNILNNNYGILLENSSGNAIYLNNLTDNIHNVFSSNSTNIWNSPDPATYIYNSNTHTSYLGNYWDDYAGNDADGDGIGDTSYIIDGGQDNYVLIMPFENYSVIPSVISANIDNYSPNDPNNPEEAQLGQPVTLSVIFTNTGNTAWQFIAGVTVWDSDGNVVGDYEKTLDTPLQPGSQTTVEWDHLVDAVGEYWVQFGVWKAQPYVAENLLDREPSPSERLIIGLPDNQPPSATNVRIMVIDGNTNQEVDRAPVTGDKLKAGYIFFDVDGDDEQSSVLKWYKNGILQKTVSVSVDQDRALSDPINRGEAWSFSIAPSDGIATGETRQSPILNISSPIYVDIEKNVEVCLFGAIMRFENRGSTDYVVDLEILNENDEALDVKYYISTSRERSERSFDLPANATPTQVWLAFDPQNEEDLLALLNIRVKYSAQEANLEEVEELGFRQYSSILIATNEENRPFSMIEHAYSFANWGVCNGMARTSVLYFVNELTIPNNKPTTYSLEKEEEEVRKNIDDYQGSQRNFWPSLELKWADNKLKNTEYDKLKKNIRNGIPMMFFLDAEDADSHAVVVYKIIEDTADGKAYLMIYDNNWPWSSDTRSYNLHSAFAYITYDFASEALAFDTYTMFELVYVKKDPWLLRVVKRSPGELRVYDSQGRATGLVGGEWAQEIPFSLYDEESENVTVFYPSDNYIYEVAGTDEGLYGLEITSAEAGETTTFTATNIPMTSESMHQYTIDWDALSQDERGVTVKLDFNGDGTFELTITTGGTFLAASATIDFDPDTISLASMGKWGTCYIELPEDYNVEEIALETVRLWMKGKEVLVEEKPTSIGDYDMDGIPDLMVKFSREAIIGILNNAEDISEDVTLTINGQVGNSIFDGTDTIRIIGEGEIPIAEELAAPAKPTDFALYQNFSNPFNPDTWIPYQLSADVDVIVRIYDISSKLIRTLSLGTKPAGFYTDKSKAAYWDGRNEAGEQVSSGVYFYTIQAGEFTAARKMVVAK